MSVEDRLYRWLGKYLDAPQWVKTPVGLVYGWLPRRVRYGAGYPRYLAEAGLRCPARLAAVAEARLRETLLWAAATVPAHAGVRPQLRAGAPVSEWLDAFAPMRRGDIKARPQDFRSTAEAAAIPPTGPVSYGWISADLNPAGTVGEAHLASAAKGLATATHQVAGLIALLRQVRDAAIPQAESGWR